ncbi:MAG TPA: SDR family NAD(P)-dependent oxidoreductase, partial [Ramlibacter sp.]
NNAGVALSATAEATSPDDFAWLMGINFWGVVHGTQAFLPHLRASGDGHVVNISSVFGLVSMPTQAAYNASKFAVRGYTEALRIELELERAPVGATCVHPGGIATNIAAAQRVDASVQGLTGMDEAAHRAQAVRLIARTSPQSAARQVLRAVQRNARRVVIGGDARMVDVLARVLGAGYQSLVVAGARAMRRRGATP